MPKTGSAAIVLFSMEHVHGSCDHVKNPAIVEQILHELKERWARNVSAVIPIAQGQKTNPI